MSGGTNYTTNYYYTDNYTVGSPTGSTNTYLTKIQYPTPQDGVAQVETFAYNYNTGFLTQSVDENGQATGLKTTYAYSDPLDRLTQISYPDGGGTTYSYDDGVYSAGSLVPSVTTTTLLNSSSSKTSLAAMDGLNHVIETELTSDPDGADIVKTTYDGEGKVMSVTNPYRGSSPPASSTITYGYDSLGRKILETEQDGNKQQWCYDDVNNWLGTANCSSLFSSSSTAGSVTGTWADYTDQNGNHWQQASDGFGRLTQVMEPNGISQTPSMQTTYNYDVLGNLLSAKQNGTSGSTARSRSFSYDSLSRLLSAQNPETGTVSYAYDLNSNVQTKTDARSIAVNYHYDNLNRLYQKNYSISSGNTTDPVVCMQYDLPGSSANGTTGRLTMDWTQAAGSSCPGPGSSQSTPPSGSISNRVIPGYDPMGRLTGDRQCPLGSSCATPYTFSYTYDLAGDPSQTILPITSSSWLTLASNWDNAQHLNSVSVTNQPGGWSGSTYMTQPTLLQAKTNTGYDPFGNLVNATLGFSSTVSNPALSVARTYDNRDRIISEADGGNAVTMLAQESTGSIAVSGLETGPLTATAKAGSGSFTVNTTGQSCSSGELSVTVGSYEATASFNQSSTTSALASALASYLNESGSPVTAVVSGSRVAVTSIATGTASNYSVSYSTQAYMCQSPFSANWSGSTLTGGVNGGSVYDAGTITATITNGGTNYTTSAVSWGQGSTASTIATGLASAVNTVAGSLVSATANGDTVELVSKTTGASTNYGVSASVTDTQTANYPTLFPSPSFLADAVSMSGGQNAATSYGTVYSYSVPAGGYAPNGNLLSYDDPIVMGSWDFQYDTLNRVAAASSTAPESAPSGHPTNPYPNYCWSYDAFGNRTEQMSASVVFASGQGGANSCSTTGNLGENVWAQYNGANNQMSATSQNSGQGGNYDPDGNVNYDGANNYFYDGEGRLCAVQTGGNGGPVTGYLYNAEGTRVVKGSVSSPACPNSSSSFSAVSAQYLLDPGGNQVTELTGSGSWAHSNIWSGGALDATYDLKGLHFHLKDPLGTRRVQAAAISSPGAIEEYCLSLPFGDALNCVVPPGAPSTADDATEQHFTGKERDTESGNDYFGARYYGSSMGRFMSPDPSGLAFANPGNPQSLNLYSYALNNPLINIDPTGMECVWDDGSYDSADDPQTGNAAGCSGQGGTYVNPDLFENALLTNGQNANIQYGSWSGQGNSTLASSWITPSGAAYGSQWAAGQEVDEALDYFYGNGAKPTLIYNNNDPFTQSFKNSLGMQGILAGITRDCSATSGNAPVGTWEAFANTMIDGPYLKSADGSTLSGYYTPEAQMGGFTSTYSRSGGVVNITVTNPITLNSLALHATAPLGIPNPTSGHLGTVNQQLNITAPDPCQ
jgi:RHS repeat-associated protein